MNDTLQALYDTIADRKANRVEGSYTCYLFDKGLDKILKKIGEESAETIIAAKGDCNGELVGELADLLYHTMVLMACKDIPLEALTEELDRRTQKIGNLKVMRDTDRDS